MDHTRKLVALLLCAIITGTTYAAEITDVMVRQRWPWSRKVDIEYVLKCTIGGEYDIEVKAYNGEVPLSLSTESLSGDIYNVRDGVRRITWDPTLTTYVEDGGLTSFRVELSLKPIPLYMIVDITEELGDSDRIEYVYENDLTNGTWGTWVRNPVTNDGSVIESVIWTGVTNDNIYKTDKVVLRRVRRGSYKMGDNKDVVLTKDFYIGIFQVTHEQWYNVMQERRGHFTNSHSRAYRPVEEISYNLIRGTNCGTNWPGVDGKGDYRVDANSFMDLLRTKTDDLIFDLPTAAQWEYACRAGTTTYYNDGNSEAPDDGISADGGTSSNAFMNVLGRYRYNGGRIYNETTAVWEDPARSCDPENGTAIVGRYRPNAWGLFDMHGNVYEWCLDWVGTETGGTDPVGVSSGNMRVACGGNWSNPASTGRATNRGGNLPRFVSNTMGFRILIALP